MKMAILLYKDLHKCRGHIWKRSPGELSLCDSSKSHCSPLWNRRDHREIPLWRVSTWCGSTSWTCSWTSVHTQGNWSGPPCESRTCECSAGTSLTLGNRTGHKFYISSHAQQQGVLQELWDCRRISHSKDPVVFSILRLLLFLFFLGLGWTSSPRSSGNHSSYAAS